LALFFVVFWPFFDFFRILTNFECFKIDFLTIFDEKMAFLKKGKKVDFSCFLGFPASVAVRIGQKTRK